MTQEIKPWSKPKVTVGWKQRNIKEFTVGKAGAVLVGCVLPVVTVVKAAPHFLLILLIRAVKRIQQSQRIVSTHGPPVGLRVLRFTVASLSCPRQQHLSPSVWAARHSEAFSCLFVFSWFSSPNLSHIVFTWHLTERSSLKHCQNSQI